MTSSEMSQRFLANQRTDGSQRHGPLSALNNYLINIDKQVHTIRYGTTQQVDVSASPSDKRPGNQL